MSSRVKRIVTLFLLLLIVTAASAEQYTNGGGGAVNYSFGYDGLSEMCNYVLTMMTSVSMLLCAIAALMTIYSSCSIYIKMNTGGDGITKDIIMLVGACLFLLSALIVLPAFFGIHFDGDILKAGSDSWKFW